MTSQVQPQVPVPVQEKRLAAEPHGKKKKNKKVSLDPTICDDEAILRDLVIINENKLRPSVCFRLHRHKFYGLVGRKSIATYLQTALYSLVLLSDSSLVG